MLLIDDFPFFRNMLAPVLQSAGYKVTAVGAAGEALAMLKDGPRLRRGDHATSRCPSMDGFEFVEAVRADPRTAELPVIALSSHDFGRSGASAAARSDFTITSPNSTARD